MIKIEIPISEFYYDSYHGGLSAVYKQGGEDIYLFIACEQHEAQRKMWQWASAKKPLDI